MNNNKFFFTLKLVLVMAIFFIVNISCNIQNNFNDVSDTNNPSSPTHFRCNSEKGELFGADSPKSPDYENPKTYISIDNMDFFLDFYYPEEASNYIPKIQYSVDITSHTPIIQNSGNVVDYAITKIFKSGNGQGFWLTKETTEYFSGTLREKSKIEFIIPEAESGETEYDLWFIGLENFLGKKGITDPQVLLCFYTGEFDMEKVKATGKKGFAEFCSLPEYGYFVCNPR